MQKLLAQVRLVLGASIVLPASAWAAGLGHARGVQVVSFKEANQSCVADNGRSATFSAGRFPALLVNSRIESVSDVSKSDDEIRLRLYGWVEEMTDFREADLVVRGKVETLNKFRTDPNIENRFLRLTTDLRCAQTAALVDSVDVVYGWRQADPALVTDTNEKTGVSAN